MKTRVLLLCLLLLLSACLSVSAQEPAARAIEFNKTLYEGIHTTASITVKDQNLNLSPAAWDKINVLITSDADPKGILLKLNETGPNTGTFSGTLKFSTAASNAVTGVIKVAASSIITAEYTDKSNPNNAAGVIVSARAAFKFKEAVIETSAENDYGTGNMLDIKITDPDANNPDRVDTITAKVGNGNITNNITVRLEETGPNTGEFVQRVWFTDRAGSRKLLYMAESDKVIIRYNDTTVPQGGSKEIIKTIAWYFQSTVITLDKESYIGYNTSADITLYNMELNNSVDKIEYVTVEVVTNNLKKLNLQLKETKRDSGIFTGTLYFGRSTDKDENIIKMTGEDSILISYVNRRNKSDIAQCYADWSPHDGRLTLNRQKYSGNGAIVAITLEDWDVAENPFTRDEVKVTAKVPGASWKRTVTLTETKRDSGVFEGTLYINGDSNRSASIKMNPDEILEIEYLDKDTTSGHEETRKASALWTGVSKPELTLDQPGYKGYGAIMTITLKDPDYNRKENVPESVEVLIKTARSMNGTRYVLKETGTDTGVFTANIVLSESVSNFSSLKVNGTDKVTVTLVDKNVSTTADFSK